MSTKIKIFSTTLLGCQRRGCQPGKMSFRHPLESFKYLKNVLASLFFKNYKMAVIESPNLFVGLEKTPESLELLSFGNERKILSKRSIDSIRGDMSSSSVSFFKDNMGNVYSAYCSEKDKCYHILESIKEEDRLHPAVDNLHSHSGKPEEEVVDTTKIIANEYEQEKVLQKDPFDKETAKKQSFRADYNDDNPPENTQQLEAGKLEETNKLEEVMLEEEAKLEAVKQIEAKQIEEAKKTEVSRQIEEEKQRAKEKQRAEEKQIAEEKKIEEEKQIEEEKKRAEEKQKAEEKQIAEANRAKTSTTQPERSSTQPSINTHFINVSKVFPEVHELASTKDLYQNPIKEDELERLTQAYNDNRHGTTLGVYRKALALYYVSLIDNSNEEYMIKLNKLVDNMYSSLEKSRHKYGELSVLKDSVFEEVIHGYVCHKPKILECRLLAIKDGLEGESNGVKNKSALVDFDLDVKRRVDNSIYKIHDNGKKRGKLINVDDSNTGFFSGRVFAWHYDLGQTYEKVFGRGGFSEAYLLESKKEILGKKSWAEFEALSKKTQNIDIHKFQKETRDLSNIVEKQNVNDVPVPLSLYNVNVMINKLKSSTKNEDKTLLDRLESYKSDLNLIIEGRNVLFCFEQEFYQRWDKSFLSMEVAWNDIEKNNGMHDCFNKITEFDELTDPIINEAQLEVLVIDHNKAGKKLEVCIEGGGPAGLMSAITQYRAGANVSLFEKRNTDYNRVQIVRLDPKTMSWLKFYLPQTYVELFPKSEQSKNRLANEKFGIIKADDYGLISINQLEDKLHKQISKLSSLSRDANGRQELERFAMTEVADVMIDDEGKSYCLVKKSPFNLDEDTVNIHEEDGEITFERKIFDILLCAGGKSSTVVNTLDPVDVTLSKNYGVCTWDIEKPMSNEFDEFDEFRNVLVLDKLFVEKLNEQFNNQLSISEQKVIFGDETPLANLHSNVESHDDEITTQAGVLVDNIRKRVKQGQAPTLQTRLFENNKRFYIGMEIPAGYEQWLTTILKDVEPDQEAVASQMLRKCWYQAVANYYGLDKHGATSDRINTKFSAQFPLKLQRVTKSPFQLGKGIIIGVGDASCTPHFMTGYGLTAVRVGVENAENLTKGLIEIESKDDNDEEKANAVHVSKAVYVNKQCNLESEVVLLGEAIIDSPNSLTQANFDDRIYGRNEISDFRKKELRVPANSTSNEKELRLKYKKSLEEANALTDRLIFTQNMLKDNGVLTNIKNMGAFFSKRKEAVNKHLRDSVGPSNATDENRRVASTGDTRNQEFVQAMSSAELITDKAIHSIRETYVRVVGSFDYSRFDNTEELESFWGMKNNDELKKMQKKKLFTAVKDDVRNKMGECSLILNKEGASAEETFKAKRKLSELSLLVAVFWPTESITGLSDMSSLTQSDEFNEMAEHLFNIRWEKKEDRVSIYSLIDNKITSDRDAYIEIEQIKKRLEQFTLCEHENSGHIKMLNNKLETLNKEVAKFVGKIREEVVFSDHKVEEIDLINVFHKEENMIMALLPNAIKDTLICLNGDEEESLQLSVQQLEEELSIMTSTLTSVTNSFLEGAVKELSDQLESELKITPSLSRELARSRIHKRRESELLAELKKKDAKPTTIEATSCEMAEKIIIDVLQGLANQSDFWKKYTETLLQLRNNSDKTSAELEELEGLEVIAKDCLIKINFLLEVDVIPGNKKILFQCDSENKADTLFDWNKRKLETKLMLEYVAIPAIVGDNNTVICKGKGARFLAKKCGIST